MKNINNNPASCCGLVYLDLTGPEHWENKLQIFLQIAGMNLGRPNPTGLSATGMNSSLSGDGIRPGKAGGNRR